jgi:hypothetical protein
MKLMSRFDPPTSPPRDVIWCLGGAGQGVVLNKPSAVQLSGIYKALYLTNTLNQGKGGNLCC